MKKCWLVQKFCGKHKRTCCRKCSIVGKMKKLWTKHRRKSMKKIRLVQIFGGNTPDQRVSFVGWWVGGGWLVGGRCTFFRPHFGSELSIYPSYARSNLAPLGMSKKVQKKFPMGLKIWWSWGRGEQISKWLSMICLENLVFRPKIQFDNHGMRQIYTVIPSGARFDLA